MAKRITLRQYPDNEPFQFVSNSVNHRNQKNMLVWKIVTKLKDKSGGIVITRVDGKRSKIVYGTNYVIPFK